MQWNNLNVLVTGGTGSFGKKFAELMLTKYHPKKLIIFSRDELKQHEMRRVWDDFTGDSPIRYFIGDVRDKDRLYRAMHGVDVVVHAASGHRAERAVQHRRDLGVAEPAMLV